MPNELHLAERLVFSAALNKRPDLFATAKMRLTDDHFLDPNLRTMYWLLERYFDQVGDLPTRAIYEQKMVQAGMDAGRTALQLELFDSLSEGHASEAEFTWAVQQLHEDRLTRRWSDGLAKAQAIIKQGITEPDGTFLKGHADSRTATLLTLSELERDVSIGAAPEGNMRGEAQEMWTDYLRREAARANGAASGVLLGIPALDRHIDGFAAGELVFLAGYSGDGKTQLCVQLAWSAVVEQGKSVVFFTTETLRDQIRRRLISRHSCHPKFGLPDGLNSRDIKNGTLVGEFRTKLAEVVVDFQNAPEYGNLYIAQVPRGATIAVLEAHAHRILRTQPVDLVIIDYIALLRPEGKMQGQREDLSSAIKGAKIMATTFDSGRGVPVVSPWQMNRTGRASAMTTRSYDSSATAETSEATNSADNLISLLAPELENTGRRRSIVVQVLKNRDGEMASVEIDADYGTSRFSEHTSMGSAQNEMLASVNNLIGMAETFGEG